MTSLSDAEAKKMGQVETSIKDGPLVAGSNLTRLGCLSSTFGNSAHKTKTLVNRLNRGVYEVSRRPQTTAPRDDRGPVVRTVETAQTFLTASEVDALVGDYLAGMGVKTLAERYGIHRATVFSHLRRRNVPSRRPGLGVDEKADAVRLARAGVSMRAIGRRMARREKEAEAAGKEAARWQSKASSYAKEELTLQTRLSQAELSEAQAAERKRQQAQQKADRQALAQRRAIESRIARTEIAMDSLRELPTPKREKLRVLMLGASSEGDLRVGREQKRIRAAVESALHRDQIELDVRPAATTADLLDGITKFRPHVVHFSGHSNEDLIVFEDDQDEPHEGVIVTARAFARAVRATDEPPLLVLLNSCRSGHQIEDLVRTVAPFAIGMSDTIEDVDAINYAAQFYAAVANGQSVYSAHASGQAALELGGLAGADLPTLAWSPDVDPTATILVSPS